MNAQPLHIEILTFEGCPNAAVAYDRVIMALEAEGIGAHIEQVDVPTVQAAQEARFLGSPSIRVNGKDVEPGAARRRAYGLMCRTYLTDGQMEGAPSTLVIRAAIHAVKP